MARQFVILLALLLTLALVGCGSDDDPHIPDNPGGGDPGGEQPPEPGTTYWWNERVFYEVFVRSFYDSDGDGTGDLQGLIQKLDYLNDGDPATDTDLGITGLWLMPVMESPSDHGYDATDYRTIEPDYGSNADFQQLVAACHDRGIAVVVDLVMNHCSNQHPWFQASAADDPTYADWFTWRSTNPGWTQPWGSGPVWHSGAQGYYYGVFWSGMPDLNYSHQPVEDEMFATATYWLQDMGADGFRLDAIKYLMEDGDVIDNAPSTFEFWTRFRQHLDTVAPEAFTVGEAWDATSVVLQYMDAGLHTCFEFDLAEDLIDAANEGTAGTITNKVEQIIEDYPYLQFSTFLANHDQRRLYSQLGGNEGRNKLAASLLLTLPGVPFLFYGEEVGMTSSWSHPDIRRPMHWTGDASAGFTTGTPWTAPAGNVATHNVATMSEQDDSLWNHYRRLTQARSTSRALQLGTYQRLGTGSTRLLAFLRSHEGQHVVAVHNMTSNVTAGWSLSVAASSLAEDTTYDVTDLLTGDSMGTVTVGEGGAVSGWAPAATIVGHESLVLELTAR